MLLTKITNFWQESYRSNPPAFWIEMFSAICVMTGSAILTYTVLAPRPDIFVPFYFLGSVTSLVAAVMRKAAWIAVLTT